MTTKRRTKAKPKKQPIWRHVSAANAPDPRVPRDDPEYGKRTVLRVFAIDSLGRLIKVDPDSQSVILAPPPVVNEDEG